ncbi:MAG: DUF6391 domain-containing protein [Chloroflexota bacterium]
MLIAELGRLTRADRVRRNHALEHAAIWIVSERHPHVELRGRSNRRGFFIFGDVETAELRSTIEEALARLRSGEVELAIHPRCGTNLVVAGLMSGIAAAAASRLKPSQNRFAYAVLAALGALMASQPLGTMTQRHLTTLADVQNLDVLDVQKRSRWGNAAHWVRTRST